MSPEEAKELKPLNTAALKVLTKDDSEDAILYINELLKTSDQPSYNQNFWFHTPDNPGDPNTHTPIQSRILREIKELEEIQKLDPNNNAEDREAFLKNFKWDDSQLTENDQKDIQEILIEFNDIFARHRLDIGINHDFKIELTPKTDDPVYSQSLPCNIIERGLDSGTGINALLRDHNNSPVQQVRQPDLRPAQTEWTTAPPSGPPKDQ